ncbi:group 1 truncated hemoglobin [Klebsiella variicola subsp. variicola]|nr:group 1 truncated hemoglobin [Klebsiella variicola subsp. variicola]
MKHPDIGHIWAHVSESSFQKEHINFVDFLCKHWGGNTVYRGRDMVTAHRGMGLTEVHWKAVFEAIDECYENFNVPQDIREEVTAFPDPVQTRRHRQSFIPGCGTRAP